MGQLWDSGATPRIHPNGFIQPDLKPPRRLHVWHPKIPYRQETYHPVHDHVFDFVSTGHSGRLVNVRYDLRPDSVNGTHVLWTAEALGDEETALRRTTPQTFRLVPIGTDVLQPGDVYRMPAFHYHESLSNEPTLTVIVRSYPRLLKDSKEANDSPNVAVPIGVIPDNNFRRANIHADVLWKLIREAHPCR